MKDVASVAKHLIGQNTIEHTSLQISQHKNNGGKDSGCISALVVSTAARPPCCCRAVRLSRAVFFNETNVMATSVISSVAVLILLNPQTWVEAEMDNPEPFVFVLTINYV